MVDIEPTKGAIEKVRPILLDKFKEDPHHEIVETLFPEGPGGWGEWKMAAPKGFEVDLEIGPTNTPLEEAALSKKQESGILQRRMEREKVMHDIADQFKKIVHKNNWYSDWFGKHPNPETIKVDVIQRIFISKYAAAKYAQMYKL